MRRIPGERIAQYRRKRFLASGSVVLTRVLVRAMDSCCDNACASSVQTIFA
jgi:hypothetical protein